jgi:hypothetical protein
MGGKFKTEHIVEAAKVRALASWLLKFPAGRIPKA